MPRPSAPAPPSPARSSCSPRARHDAVARAEALPLASAAAPAPTLASHRPLTPARVVRFAGLFSAALATGVLVGTRTGRSPSTKGFSPSTYVEGQQTTVRNLRPDMAPLLPGSAAANLAVATLSRREHRSPAFELTLIGALSQLAAVVLTARFELPIDARVLTWPPESPPNGREGLRDRWETVHTARTAISVVGLGCLVAAALTSPERSASHRA